MLNVYVVLSGIGFDGVFLFMKVYDYFIVFGNLFVFFFFIVGVFFEIRVFDNYGIFIVGISVVNYLNSLLGE